MTYIEVRLEYDSWCKERGLDTQAFVDRMLGECIRTDQEIEAKEAARVKVDEENQKQLERAKKVEFKPVKAEKVSPVTGQKPEEVAEDEAKAAADAEQTMLEAEHATPIFTAAETKKPTVKKKKGKKA